MTRHQTPAPADVAAPNVARILALADRIERVDPPPGIDGFNMSAPQPEKVRAWSAPGALTDCKTAACIGGWCRALAGDLAADLLTATASHLGVGRDDAFSVCYPGGFRGVGRPLGAITPAVAARCLRNLAASILAGEPKVDWPRALAETE